jgi:hypothetical protein
MKYSNGNCRQHRPATSDNACREVINLERDPYGGVVVLYFLQGGLFTVIHASE